MTRGPAMSLPATLDVHTALSVAPVSVTVVPARTAWSTVVSSGGAVAGLAGLAVRGVAVSRRHGDTATRPGATATVRTPAGNGRYFAERYGGDQ
ncbi:hypothetical protein [Streptosporangium sp. G12]